MALQGFNKSYYLNAKLEQLQNDPATAAEWAGKTADFLESKLVNGYGLTAEQHYVQYGYQEGLAPNAFFDPQEYIRAKAEDMFNDPSTSYISVNQAAEAFVNTWGGNVYQHYLQYGEAEGINPSNEFDLSGYLDAKLAQLQAEGNTEITTVEQLKAAFEAQGLSVLEHFVRYGQDEGLAAPAVPANEQVDGGSMGTPGQVFTLTASADTYAGTENDDTIRALTVDAQGNAATTLSAFDEINGGAGQDTLNVYTTAAQNNGFPASASVQNVETVNVFNSAAAVASLADASNYEGVEALWQHNASADVTNLAASTTAGFNDVTLSANANPGSDGAPATTATARTVSATNEATSASVALDGVVGDAADANAAAPVDNTSAGTNATVENQAALNVEGAALNTVNVEGTLAQATTAAGANAASLALNVTVGADEQTLTVNTGVATVLTANEAAGATGQITTVDASKSTGGVTFVGDGDVSSIQTGAGSDRVTVNTSFTATVTAASVATGAGDDVIALGANITDAGDVTVSAGEGNDVVNITSLDAISTRSLIDGGEGRDVLATNGGTLVAEDYTMLNNVFENFEELVLTTASAFDASRLAGYNEFNLQAGSTGTGVTNVAADQLLTTSAALTASAAGFVADDGSTANVNELTYAGSLDITVDAGTSGSPVVVTANAESVALTVDAEENEAAATLAGLSESATITLERGVDDNNSATTTDDALYAANIVVDNTTAGTLDNLASLTLVGNGSADVDNIDGNDLVTVDASGLNSADIDGNAIAGLDYTSTNTKVETVSLGSGIDTLNMSASTVASTDSITGFNIAVNDAGNYDAQNSDTLTFGGANASLTAIGEIEAASLDLALVDAAANVNVSTGVVFDFGGDSYVYQSGDAIVDDTDDLIQLVGGVDQDLAVQAITVA